MKKSTVGVIVGAAVGLGVAWLFRDKLRPHGVKEVPITLKRRENGGPGIEDVPDVEVSRRLGPMKWVISNPKDAEWGAVTVRIDRWTRNEVESEPPVIPVPPFERTVKPGQQKTLPAAGNPLMPYGDYRYDILIDGQTALDPIVRLVL